MPNRTFQEIVKSRDARKRVRGAWSEDKEYMGKVIKKHSNEKVVLGGDYHPEHGAKAQASYERGPSSVHSRGWHFIELDMLG